MANIMLNEVCNLKCPYCFADEFVNKNPREISIKDFKKALDFALSSGYDERIGLIGGEPTLHSNFKEILVMLINDSRVKNVTIFTNGIKIIDFINEISHPKMHLLINCNSPKNMGDKAFNTMVSNIETLIEKHYLRDRITLGINMYKPNFDYKYILEILTRFKMPSVRTSISVPNVKEYIENPLAYFEKMKPRVLEFYNKLGQVGVIPFFDCNAMPSCVWTSKERSKAMKVYPNAISKTNIFNLEVKCNPIIDILPDLTIIRCFGLSEHTKKRLSDFNNIEEARNYYLRTIDAFSCNTCHSNECSNCRERLVGKCNGGCLCFKIDEIVKAKKHCETMCTFM